MEENWYGDPDQKGKAPFPCTTVTEKGIIQTHCFLQAKLPSSGETYVIDPAARGCNYRKNKRGQIIVHSSWEAWKEDFPGEVLAKYTIKGPNTRTTVQDYGTKKRKPLILRQVDPYGPTPDWSLFKVLHHIGNGPKTQNISRMAKNLIKYLDRKICRYCGRVEDLHPEPPLPKEVTRRPREAVRMYSFKGVELKDCGRCRKVKYCKEFCQKLDWPRHKIICRKKD